MIPKRETTERVVVHFTGNGGEDMDSIRAEHEARGLPEVGFHFFIDAAGKLFMGRHQSRVGAHHPEFDAISIGVCVIGDRFFLNEEQELALILLMDKLRADYPQAEKVNYVYRQPTG